MTLDTERAFRTAQVRRGFVALFIVSASLLAIARAPHAVISLLRAALDGPSRAPATPARAVQTIATSAGRSLRVEVVAAGLDTPWDLVWGPDTALWFTERPGRVSRLDLRARQVRRIADIEVAERGESGLMGMAFHPDFPRTPFVYFTHSFATGISIRNRLIRMTWTNGRLENAETLVDDIPGAANHDGSRIIFGPDGMLYMTTGDAGNAAFAQDRNSLAGKILRLTPDGRPAPSNPLGSAVWTWGHRNPQGLAFAESGALYSAEHGPDEADEVNWIGRGRNYGWPDARGACNTEREAEFCRRTDVVEPLAEFTPTIGISGLAIYEHDRIAGWRGSLLVASLRGHRLVRIALSEDGRTTTEQEDILRGQYGRLRDVLVSPDGSVFVATSNRDGRGSPAQRDDRILRIRP